MKKKYYQSLIFIVFILIIVSMLTFIVSTNTKIEELPSISITSEFPPIRRFRNVLTSKECLDVINYGKSKLTPSYLDNGIGLGFIDNSIRTSKQCWINFSDIECLNRLSKYVSYITGLPVENQEMWQLLRYRPGQKYDSHYDSNHPKTKDYENVKKKNKIRGWGDRVYTFFIYLNDNFIGGETKFNKLGIKFHPQEGTAIMWENLTKNKNRCHEMSQHEGCPVKSGEKWAINVWVRQFTPM